MWASLEQSAKDLGIADHVHFLGYRTDAPGLYGCSDMFAFMTYREGLPVALMEAMCSGMSIVCTRVRGNTDLIRDGENGRFVDNDPKALAEAILEQYRNPELRAAFGKAAAESAKQYDETQILNRVKDIYLSL